MEVLATSVQAESVVWIIFFLKTLFPFGGFSEKK